VELATEVRYSGVVVGRGTPIRDRGAGGAFVVLAEPLPVGTPITLRGESGDEDARVTEVVESSNPDVAGMRVSFGDTAAKAAPAKAAPAKAAPVVEAVPVVEAALVVEAAPEVHAAPESSAAVVEVPTSDSTASSAHPGDPAGDPQAGGSGKRKRRRR